jgi:hypothetical protein
MPSGRSLAESVARLLGTTAIVLTALCASMSADAWGKCAGAHAVVSPPNGSAVPIDPTLYFFWPRRDSEPPKVRARIDGGATLPIEQTVIAKTDSFTAYRLRVKTSRPGAILIELPQREYYWGPQSWRYQVSAEWQRPTASPADALKVHSESYRWTCSYQQSQNLRLPGHAAAYRLAIFQAGGAKGAPAQELVVPSHMRHFFERQDKPNPADSDEIELGFINCFGPTFVWQGKPIEVEVFALFPDGSESPVSRAPMRVEPPPSAPHGKGEH